MLVVCVVGRYPLTGFSAESWAALAALALVTQLGGWLAINYALGHIRASIASVTLLGQPVLTALFSIPVLGETLSAEQLVGGALVLAGISLVHTRLRRAPDAVGDGSSRFARVAVLLADPVTFGRCARGAFS